MNAKPCVDTVSGSSGRLSYDNTTAAGYFSAIYDDAAPPERDRIDEIVAAQFAWKAEKTARWNAAGLPAVYAENDRLADIASGLRYEICHTPALTMTGLLAKAAIVAHCFGPDDTFADYCAHELEKTGTPSGEAVANSIAADLIEMLSKGSANV